MKTLLRFVAVAFWAYLGVLGSANAQSPAISTTLPTNAKAYTATPFAVQVAKGNATAANVKLVMQLTGNDAEQKVSQIELKAQDGTDISFGATAEAMLGTFAFSGDLSTEYSILFKETGNYTFSLKLLNAANDEVLATANKTVAVGFVEPTINTTLDAYPILIQGQETLFHPFVTAGDRAGDLVNLQIMMTNPAQAQQVQFSRSISNDASTFEDLTFNEAGVITVGPEEGYALQDASNVDANLYKAVFNAPGTYNYTFKIVRVDGTVLASVNEEVTVSETAIGSTLKNKGTLVTTLPVEFTVSASSASLAPETMVLGQLKLSDPAQANAFVLERKGANGEYQQVPVGTDGVAALTPDAIMLSNFKNLDFRITFSSAGTFAYTLELLKTEGNEVMASASESVTVRAFQDATVSTTLAGQQVAKDAATTFTINAVPNDVATATMVKVRLTLSDISKAENVALEMQDAAGSYQAVTFTNGVAQIGAAEGMTLSQVNDLGLRISFNAAGTYAYTLELINAENSSVVATVTETAEAVAPTGIKKGFEKGGFAVYPNITRGPFRIDLAQARNVSIYVIDIMGRTVLSKGEASGIVTLDLSHVAKGTYVVKIEDGVNVNTQRLVVH